jgi:hypothetical protein
MVGITGVYQLGLCACVRLPPPGRRRTGLFHGAPRKTRGGGALGWLPSSPWNLTLLAGAADSTEEDGWGHDHGPYLRRRRGCDRDEEGGSRIRGYKAEGGAKHLLKRFECTNDTMINNHRSPSKGRGQVYLNEEQFAFPLFICNQIQYHVFFRQQ